MKLRIVNLTDRSSGLHLMFGPGDLLRHKETPYPYLGTQSGKIIIPIVGTIDTKRTFEVISNVGGEDSTVYKGSDPRAAADTYAKVWAEETFRQLTDTKPKAAKTNPGLSELLGFFGSLVGDMSLGKICCRIEVCVDAIPDGSFHLGFSGKEGVGPKIIAGANDNETAMVVFEMVNKNGLEQVGEETTRLRTIAAENDIETDGLYTGSVLIFAMKKGESVYLTNLDDDRVFKCTWDGDQVVQVDYSKKEFEALEKMSAKEEESKDPTPGTARDS